MASAFDRFKRFWPSEGPLASFAGQRLALTVAVVVLAAIPIAVGTAPVGLVAGKPAPRTYRATRDIHYVDASASRILRAEARASVSPVYVHDAEAPPVAARDVRDLFTSVMASRRAFPGDVDRQEAWLRTRLKIAVSERSLRTALSLDDAGLDTVSRDAEQLVGTLMSRRIRAADLDDARLQASEYASLMPLRLEERALVADVAGRALRVTLEVDEAATSEARRAAEAKVAPVVVAKQAGENIVVRGEVVTSQQVKLVSSLGRVEAGSMGALAAAALLMAGMVLAGGAYLRRFEDRVWRRYRDLLILGTLVVGMAYMTRFVVWLAPETPPFLLPVPLTAMLATLLVNHRVGIVVGICSTVVGSLLGFSTGATLVGALIVSVVAVVAVASMTERRRLFVAGGAVAVSMGAAGALVTAASGVGPQASITAGGWGLVGGLLSSVLAYGLLPFFEVVFGVTTDVRLLELANPSHPLLKRLMVEASGTYSHSVMTGNLAETAADAIGANPLLARVGAYYHDIGKVRRPGFFVENQAGSENPHDRTSPTLSALIITAHVREGVELAREYRLPEEIVAIIRQHHGTSLVSYFWDKASRGSGAPMLEADFRYTGEPPSSREAALVMLADSAEAAVRSMRNPSPVRIEQAVRKVVDDRLADGQLAESGLTLADIERVVAVYSHLLASVHHARLEYPEPVPTRRS
ncbi:MAG: HDIG domain-containing metalloprotein [Coriobacteriia bacterium]